MEKKAEKIEYQDVELKLIDEPDGVIRLEINEDDISSLADNIKEVGQIQAILVAVKGKRFEIIAGHRRYLAIKSLGRKKIKSVVRVMGREEIALVRASENLLRKDLSPIEEGAVYADLISEHNMSIKMVGDKFGKAPSSIKDRLRLLELAPEIQKAIHDGKIGLYVGTELGKIDHDRERNKMLEYAINNGCSIETAEQWVRDYKRSDVQEEADSVGGGRVSAEIVTQKIYQACEVCEEPVEIQEMKMLRICGGCMKIIIENLK